MTHGSPGRHGGGTGQGHGRGIWSTVCEDAVETTAINARAMQEMNERMTHQ